MTPIGGCIRSKEKATVGLLIVIFLVMISKVEKADAFLFRSHHLPPSIMATQAKYNAAIASSLKATKGGNVVHVTDSNYRELFAGEKPLLLDAFAPWCGPCKLIEPVLEQCAEDWKDSLVVGKFDVEDASGENCKSRDLKVELILQGAMPRALPALILVRNNQVLETWKGVISPTQLQEMLEKHVVDDKRVVGSNHNTIESNAPKEGEFFCENGVCKRKFKTIDNLENNKTRPFRGIGLVNKF